MAFSANLTLAAAPKLASPCSLGKRGVYACVGEEFLFHIGAQEILLYWAAHFSHYIAEDFSTEWGRQGMLVRILPCCFH